MVVVHIYAYPILQYHLILVELVGVWDEVNHKIVTYIYICIVFSFWRNWYVRQVMKIEISYIEKSKNNEYKIKGD